MELLVYPLKMRLRAYFAAVCVAVCASGSLLFAQPAAAQAFTDAHLQAARRAIAAIHATDQFDSFLPDTALSMKNELSRRDPNLAGLISKTVDAQAMLLVPRRADLEKEAARVYAKHFTEAELNAIAKFYASATGKKLLKEGPASMAESVGAYEIWRQGVAQDLGDAVGKALDAQLNAAASQRAASQKPAGAGRKAAPNAAQGLSRGGASPNGLNFGQ